MAKKGSKESFANVRKPKDYVDGKNGKDDGYKQTTKFGGNK